MFRILCLLLFVLAAGPALSATTAPATQPAAYAPSPYAQLQQLGQWLRSDRPERVGEWVRAHSEDATRLAKEAAVDVYASPWLMLPPLHPESQALLPVLLEKLGLPAPPDPELCGWTEGALLAELLETPAECEALPGYLELEMLTSRHAGLESGLIYDLPSEQGPASVSIVMEADPPGPLSERGQLQIHLLMGRIGLGFAERRDELAQALSLARAWQSRDMEALIRLAQAELAHQELHSPLFTLRAHERKPDEDLRQRIRLNLLEAEELAESLYSDRLRILALLARARFFGEPAAAERAAGLIAAQPELTRQVLELQLADSWLLINQADKGHRSYQRLLAQGTRASRQAVVERLLHLARRQDLEQLRDRFAKEADPELRPLLLQAFYLLRDSEPLWRMVEAGTEPKLRLYALNALTNYLNTGGEAEQGRLIPLLQDPDPEIRSSVAGTVANLDDPVARALLLPWLESDDPSLRHSALFAARTFDRPDLLPKALPLLRLGEDEGLMLVVELVQKWGSAAEIPALEALLPRLRPPNQLRVRLAIARLQGPESWLSERIRQAASPHSWPSLMMDLMEALQADFISRDQLKAYLNHPDKQIQAAVQDAYNLPQAD